MRKYVHNRTIHTNLVWKRYQLSWFSSCLFLFLYLKSCVVTANNKRKTACSRLCLCVNLTNATFNSTMQQKVEKKSENIVKKQSQKIYQKNTHRVVVKLQAALWSAMGSGVKKFVYAFMTARRKQKESGKKSWPRQQQQNKWEKTRFCYCVSL